MLSQNAAGSEAVNTPKRLAEIPLAPVADEGGVTYCRQPTCWRNYKKISTEFYGGTSVNTAFPCKKCFRTLGFAKRPKSGIVM